MILKLSALLPVYLGALLLSFSQKLPMMEDIRRAVISKSVSSSSVKQNRANRGTGSQFTVSILHLNDFPY